ncbi:Rnf-Nqr domain containing protein, partial [Candidatus Hakubella thermalkaliphila]
MFVTITDLSMAAYCPALHKTLSVFNPLIVVNCIIMGRAEAFASSNTPVRAIADGLGMGIGFILTLILLSGARELLGNGTIFGALLPFKGFELALIIILSPVAFFAIGIMIAIFNKLFKMKREGDH